MTCRDCEGPLLLDVGEGRCLPCYLVYWNAKKLELKAELRRKLNGYESYSS